MSDHFKQQVEGLDGLSYGLAGRARPDPVPGMSDLGPGQRLSWTRMRPTVCSKGAWEAFWTRQ